MNSYFFFDSEQLKTNIYLNLKNYKFEFKLFPDQTLLVHKYDNKSILTQYNISNGEKMIEREVKENLYGFDIYDNNVIFLIYLKILFHF